MRHLIGKVIFAAIFALTVAYASTARSETASVTYAEAVKLCGVEWRARPDKSAVKGRDAWNAFRATCVLGKGYTPKAKRAKKS